MNSFNDLSESMIKKTIGKTVRKRLGIDWISICAIAYLVIGSFIFKDDIKNYGWIIGIIFIFNAGVRIERQKWIVKEEESRYFKGEYN